MKQDILNGMKLANANVDEMQMLVIISKIVITINGDVNANSSWQRNMWKKDLFGILVLVIVNAINYLIWRTFRL